MTRGRSVVSAAAAVVVVGIAVAAGALFLGNAKAAVGPLPGDALLLPADSKFVGGIDVKRFVQSTFDTKYASPQAKNRPETFRELEEKTGLNPERDIEQLVFGGTPPGGAARESGIVVAIGRFDRAKISQTIETEKSPLQKEIGRLVRRFAAVGIAVCVLVAVFYGRSRGLLEGLLAGLAVAMSVLPEEFPVVLTVFLALGALRISRHGVLTRRIPAIESLGAATVLCVDKTGP